MVKDTQNNLLFHYLFFKGKKYTQVTAKNRRPMQKKTTAWLFELAFEWISFSRDV